MACMETKPAGTAFRNVSLALDITSHAYQSCKAVFELVMLILDL